MQKHLSAWLKTLKRFWQSPNWHWVLPIKGHFYYDAELAEAAGWLSNGRPLTLHPEPDNPYDGNAIQIYLPMANPNKNALLGYIPFTHSRAMTWLLQQADGHSGLQIKLVQSYRQYHRLVLHVEIRGHLSIWQQFQLYRRLRKVRTSLN